MIIRKINKYHKKKMDIGIVSTIFIFIPMEDIGDFSFPPPPESVIADLGYFLQLDNTTLSALKNAISSVKFPVSTKDLVVKTLRANPALDKNIVGRVVFFLRTLFDQFNRNEDYYQSNELFIERLIRISNDESFLKKAEHIAALIEFMEMRETIGFPTKVFQVQHANERNFVESQIITDMRPIYPDGEITGEPVASVIVHSLKIGFFENGEHKDLFFAIDAERLIEIRKTIDRALSKQEQLITMLGIKVGDA